MKLRMAFLLGLVVALGVTPGCRRKKAAAEVTPWLELDRQPPEEGAMGVLSGPVRGQQEFKVYWVKARQGESWPGFEFLNWFRGPRAEKVMAVECLSLSAPLVAGEPSEHPAVFCVDKGRALIDGVADRIDALEAKVLEALEPHERQALRGYLDRIQDSIG